MQWENKWDYAAREIAHGIGGVGGGVQQINFRTEHSCQEMDGEQEGYRG